MQYKLVFPVSWSQLIPLLWVSGLPAWMVLCQSKNFSLPPLEIHKNVILLDPIPSLSGQFQQCINSAKGYWESLWVFQFYSHSLHCHPSIFLIPSHTFTFFLFTCTWCFPFPPPFPYWGGRLLKPPQVYPIGFKTPLPQSYSSPHYLILSLVTTCSVISTVFIVTVIGN